MNRLPILAHFNQGRDTGTLRLDYVGPFLQLFVGHCVFVRRDLIAAHLTEQELNDFAAFRDLATNGKDLSLRSMVAWARSNPSAVGLNKKLEQIWSDSIVGTQFGTDFHISVRRTTAILADLAGRSREESIAQDPVINGIADLSRGFP